MGLDVYLNKYTGENNFRDDSEVLDQHYDALANMWEKARVEVAGERKPEPVKTDIFSTSASNLSDEQLTEIKRLVRVRQMHYIEQNNLPLQLGEYDDPQIHEEEIEIDSKKHPEHMFKIGYMRSSYNRSGFNSVVRELVGMDLNWVFDLENQEDDYIFAPDWNKALVRINILLDQLKMDPGYSVLRCDKSKGEKAMAYLLGMSDKRLPAIPERDSLREFMNIRENVVFEAAEDTFMFDGFEIWPHGKTLLAVVHVDDSIVILLENKHGEPVAYNPKSDDLEKRAVEIFNQKLEQYNKSKNNAPIDFSSFSCGDGDFFLKGVKTYGFTESRGYSGPCLDFVTHNEEGPTWYIEAAEIVKEMIEWVLKQDDIENYYFRWSA